VDSSQERLNQAQALWDEYGPIVSRSLIAYERDAERRKDLLHDVFLGIFESVDRITAARTPKAYVLRIAHNIAADHVAREAKRGWVSLDKEPACSVSDPAVHAAHLDEKQRLITAVCKLPMVYRQVTVLLLEDLKPAEIAEALGLEPGAVRVRLTRARSMLKEAFK
jgi:RNA polymerase sigma-70 factor (ECF subfamily)